ncbi:NUDIX hydrolase [Streptococcus caprae]|uniref:NUDIX hydrolase n=1 Tax=Streptococcus caprae TaxID=1640501 RepID=A0ABV8CU16_9STRE
MKLLNERFDFSGTKIALLCDNDIVVTLRDDKPDIAFPNTWELVGGGREEGETVFECTAREVYEELGLTIRAEQIVWCRVYSGLINPHKQSVFLVGHISKEDVEQIVFGDEGQGYKLIPVDDFLKDETIIPQLRQRMADYVREVER